MAIAKPSRNPGENFYAYIARVNEYFAQNASPEPIKNQRPDLDRSRSLENLDLDRSRSSFDKSDPDGLSHAIKGKFSELLKQDPLYLQARAWKCHPAVLTAATQRMNSDWVRQQIDFVARKKGLNAPGRYLAKILANNQF